MPIMIQFQLHQKHNRNTFNSGIIEQGIITLGHSISQSSRNPKPFTCFSASFCPCFEKSQAAVRTFLPPQFHSAFCIILYCRVGPEKSCNNLKGEKKVSGPMCLDDSQGYTNAGACRKLEQLLCIYSLCRQPMTPTMHFSSHRLVKNREVRITTFSTCTSSMPKRYGEANTLVWQLSIIRESPLTEILQCLLKWLYAFNILQN